MLSNFWQTFGMPSFCGTEAILAKFGGKNVLLRNAKNCEGARVFRRSPFESFSKVNPKTSILRGEAFHELRRGPKSTTAAKEPSARARFFEFPGSSCPWLPRSSSFASFCGRKRFWKNSWAPSQPMKCPKRAPSQLIGPRSSSGYIFLYEYICAYGCVIEPHFGYSKGA